MNKHQANIGRRILNVSNAVLKKLESYTWPGNIRELENVIERFMITSMGDALEIDDWYPRIDVKILSPKSENDILSLDEMEAQYIRQVLKLTNWKVFGEDGAAKKLDINPKTLSSRMIKLGVKKEKG